MSYDKTELGIQFSLAWLQLEASLESQIEAKQIPLASVESVTVCGVEIVRV